ncbi:MAG TPA: hypothetical protein VK140_09295 [Ktedonobacteraceae bacterium]|nr:hypothetical protein [Ktedonobacteraceae bacterium]
MDEGWGRLRRPRPCTKRPTPLGDASVPTPPNTSPAPTGHPPLSSF